MIKCLYPVCKDINKMKAKQKKWQEKWFLSAIKNSQLRSRRRQRQRRQLLRLLFSGICRWGMTARRVHTHTHTYRHTHAFEELTLGRHTDHTVSPSVVCLTELQQHHLTNCAKWEADKRWRLPTHSQHRQMDGRWTGRCVGRAFAKR